ncbi:MAG: SAM-dependent methyltransferase [Minisyncoccia bacterium]
MKRNFKNKNKWKDIYTDLARKLGYPARSVFKLKEINEIYKIIKKGDKVLDLGASPGSWSLYALKIVGKKGRVVAIDLNDLEIVFPENLEFIKFDILNDEIFSKIKENFNVVLSDLAPLTSGILDLDKENSLILAKRAFEIAKNKLKDKGNFVCKIFESEKINSFLKEIKRYFNFVKRYRPKATRKRSSEIYIIAKEFQKINL